MSTKFFSKGTILIPSGPSHDPEKRHLFIVINDACEKAQHLIVPISTWINTLCDDACILEKNSHPFIKKKSYILYREARLINSEKLNKGVEEGHFEVREDISTHHYLRVKNGVLRSKHTKRRIKKYLENLIETQKLN